MKFSTFDWDKRFQQQATWTQNFRSYLFRNIITEKDLSILEVGSGTGVITEQLSRLDHFSIFGVDISPKRVQFAKKFDPNSCFSTADGLYLPFPEGCFDVTCCHYFLLWVSSPFGALTEMLRVTKTGGHVVVFAEPDYSKRNDLPEELLEIGIAQFQSLQLQGADPEIGSKVKGMYQQLSMNIEEAGVYQSDSSLHEKENIQQEITILRNDLSFLFDNKRITELISHFQRIYKAKKFQWTIPTHYVVGKKLGHIAKNPRSSYNCERHSGRGAARFSALAWGARSRRFKSSRPDLKNSQ